MVSGPASPAPVGSRSAVIRVAAVGASSVDADYCSRAAFKVAATFISPIIAALARHSCTDPKLPLKPRDRRGCQHDAARIFVGRISASSSGEHSPDLSNGRRTDLRKRHLHFRERLSRRIALRCSP